MHSTPAAAKVQFFERRERCQSADFGL